MSIIGRRMQWRGAGGSRPRCGARRTPHMTISSTDGHHVNFFFLFLIMDLRFGSDAFRIPRIGLPLFCHKTSGHFSRAQISSFEAVQILRFEKFAKIAVLEKRVLFILYLPEFFSLRSFFLEDKMGDVSFRSPEIFFRKDGRRKILVCNFFLFRGRGTTQD